MLKKFLPGYYQKSASVNILMGLYATLFDGVREKLKTQDQDLFIVTAMNTVLHEKDVGLIPIESDIMTRRSRVITKLMGNGVFSKAELIELVYTYDNTVVTVEKIGDYIYSIRFTEHGGAPENIEEITNVKISFIDYYEQ